MYSKSLSCLFFIFCFTSVLSQETLDVSFAELKGEGSDLYGYNYPDFVWVENKSKPEILNLKSTSVI